MNSDGDNILVLFVNVLRLKIINYSCVHILLYTHVYSFKYFKILNKQEMISLL